MNLICAVEFSKAGTLHYVNPQGLDLAVGEKVVVDTDHGPMVATVVWAAERVPGDEVYPIVRRVAEPEDLQREAELRHTKARVLIGTQKLVREHRLPMKILAVDPQQDTGKSVIYYTSPETVDFRSLLRDLSATLHTRVELRQVAARDAVKVTGAVGGCGRPTCCTSFLQEFPVVTLIMAKEQDLPANPMRISGVCGRLLCCLRFEQDAYREFRSSAPRIGQTVQTPQGSGRVVGHRVPAGQVHVELDADGAITTCAVECACPGIAH